MAALLLVGMMGTGKTTIGTRVATSLGLEYWDNDALVERVAGKAKQELLASQGEKALRRFERQALELVLAAPQPVVAGVAGGVFLERGSVSLVQQARAAGRAGVVWLTAPLDVLVTRLREAPEGRPWLGGDVRESVRGLARARDPGYRAVADLTCDTDDGDPDAVAARVVAWWRSRPGR